jgi:lysozyme
MKTSSKGIALIKRFEGNRLEAYKDLVGVWTIGYGHTSMAGAPKVEPGMKITQAEAEDILIRDLVKYETGVSKALTKVPTQNQFDAMVSLCYNIGPAAFAKSSIVRHFNAGNVEAAANSFLLWKKAGGKVIQGLVNRRSAERELFLSKSEPAPPPLAPIVPAPTVPVTLTLWERIKAWFK